MLIQLIIALCVSVWWFFIGGRQGISGFIGDFIDGFLICYIVILIYKLLKR